MKQAKGNLISSRSCSCTSCLYRSGSERPSLRRFVAQGSRIDKLYYGKYLPLRERKLLGKLVRTRAVYDDVRNQLLSGSSSSNSKLDLRPKKRVSLNEKEHAATKSSDISALVGLVDKGEVSPSDISSECCSCCSCSSKISLHDGTPGMHKHKHGHTGQRMASKSSVISRHKKGNEYEARKNVRFMTKRIRSDPCTCTLKFSKMIKRQTKAVLKKINAEQPEPVLERLVAVEEQQRDKRMKAKKIKRSLNQKIERSKNRLFESMEEGTRKSLTKLKESKTKLKQNLESVAKKSIEKIKQTYRTNKEKMEAQQIGDDKTVEYAEGKSFKIRKDSLIKFKEKLKRKQELNKVMCEFECFPEECVPEECFERITKRALRKIKGKGYRDSYPQYLKYEKGVGDTPSKADMHIQAQATGKSIGTEKQTPAIRKTDANKRASLAGRYYNLEMKQKVSTERGSDLEKNNNVTISTTVCECPMKRRTKSAESLKSVPRTVPKHSTQAVSVSSINVAEKKELYKSKSATKHNNLKEQNVPHRHVSIPKTKPSKDENLPHNSTSVTKVKRSKEEVHLNHSRQVIRIGSNFSFNVEFYKEKPTLKSSEVKFTKEPKTPVQNKIYKVKKKDGHNESRKHSSQHRKTFTDTRRKSSTKNTQSFGHPLKRCFCTLKLKTKKTTSVAESIQTTKMHTRPLLLPYECEPLVCLPGKCDPKECDKRIRKRNKHYHSVPTNAKPRTKSTSSHTSKSGSSAASKKIQAYSIKKPVRYKASTIPPVSRMTENKPKKQAVRTGSTFSFDIEFSKGNPTFAQTEKNIIDTAFALKQKKENDNNIKLNKSVDKAKRYTVRKYSQISSSGVKSRYTLTKNSLRRCFCTTKLGKHGKGKTKASVTSKSTLTTQDSILDVPKKSIIKTISTEKTVKMRKTVQRKLLPYECEPGLCIPGYCKPNKCKELIIKRQSKRLKGHSRKFNTENIKTKSTSSLTTRSVKPSNTKKVQSASETYESRVYKQHSKKNSLVQKQVKSMVNDGPKRQAVRMGSTFSFNVEFFKEGAQLNDPIFIVRQPPKATQHHNKLNLRDRDSQSAIKPKQKSELVQAKNKYKNISIGPAIKRCFCTLKLQKAGTNKKILSTGTNTANYKEKMPQKYKTSSVGTKTKENFKSRSQLQPFECEPNICIPGECDPYRCLEIIKRRDYRRISYEKGVLTEPSKMTSASSSTQKLVHKSKNKYIQSNIRDQRKSNKKSIQAEPTPALKFSNRSGDTNNVTNQSHQSVKIGSKFSFDIEFYKDRSCERKAKVKGANERGDVKTNKDLKNKGANPMKKYSSQHKSQGVEIKKNHQAIGIGPIFKRCFCTLNFQKKDLGVNEVSSPLRRTTNQPKVYTIRRMSVEKTNILCKPLLTRALETATHLNDLHSFESEKEASIETNAIRNLNSKIIYSSFSDISKTNVQLKSKKMRSYFCKCNHYPPRAKTEDHKFRNFELCHSMRISSKFELNIPADRSTQTRLLTSGGNNDLENQVIEYIIEPDVTELNRGMTEIMGVRPYLSRCFCTMNMHIANQEKLYKNKLAPLKSGTKHNFRKSKIKLEPYECEPGICVPGQCNPITCKELILKRLMKTVSKMSNTEKHLKSSSSDTHRSASAKAKKLQSNVSLSPRTKSENRKLSRVKFEKSLPSHKQAVHIGSNFSFNIEFSKDSKNVGDIKEYKIPSRKTHYKSINTNESRRNRGTKGIELNSNDQQSQSKYKIMETKASTTTPLLKRCFCTLKLQKKGIDLTITSQKSNTMWKPMFKNDTVQKQNHPQPTEIYHQNQGKKLKPSSQLDPPKWNTAITTQTQTTLQAKQATQMHPKKAQSFLKQCVLACRSTLKCLIASKETKISSPKFKNPAETDDVSKGKIITYNNATLEPYECEPNVCTPGECDPYECEKRIRKRNFKRESGISTKRFITKSTSSMTKEAHKSKYMNAKPIDNYKKSTSRLKTKNISKLAKPTKFSHEPTKLRPSKRHKMISLDATVDNPHRQAVLIGSTFSFDIEFSKNKSYGNMQRITKSPKSKTLKSVCSSTRQSSISSKHKKTQQLRTLRNRDTQFFAQTMRSTLTQAAPFLQRCFCTLKLHKPNNILNTASKKTVADFPHDEHSNNIQSPVSTVEKSTHTPKEYHYGRWNLEPYECEPGVCIPGKCNPYECERRIKVRENRTCSKLSNTEKFKEMTRFVSTDIGYKAKKSQAKFNAYEKRHKRRNNVKEALATNPTDHRFTESPNRQAVHIGSSFSFDVQIYKDKPFRKSINPYDSRNISKLKDETVNNTGSSTKMEYDNKSSGHEVMALSHGQTQAYGPNMESKGSGVGLLLKRCFCTLKLQKYGTKQQLLQEPENKSQYKSNSPIYHAAPIADNKSRITSLVKSISRGQHIDTKCDPHICNVCNLEHIKKSGYTSVENQNKTKVHTKTCTYDTESTSKLISTSKKSKITKARPGTCACDVNSAVKNKATTDKKIKNKNHFAIIGKCTCDGGNAEPQSGLENASAKKKNKSKGRQGKCTCDSGDVESTSGLENDSAKKKSKSIGHSGKCICDAGDAKPMNQPPNNSIVKKNKKKSYQGMCEYNSCKGDAVNKFENVSARKTNESKGYLDKCVCDPYVTENVNKIKNVSVTNAKNFSKKCPCDPCDSITKNGNSFSEKMNKSRDYSRKWVLSQSHVLEPYECEPNTCTPGICDPYECNDRLQQKRMRKLGTETIFPTKKSKFTLKDADYKSSNTQNWNGKGNERMFNTRKQRNSCKEDFLDTHSSEDSHRQVVRMGSSFSFDLEFYKNRLLMDSDKKYMSNKINQRKSKKSIQTSKPQTLKSRASEGKSSLYSKKTQAVTVVNKQSKATGVGPLLKRCFCTLKLQMSGKPTDTRQLPIVQKTVKAKPERSGVIIKNKGISTKIKHLSGSLEPYQCEPGTCIPGKCNPYKCEERIKKRNRTYTSRNISTHDKFSYATASTMTGKSVFSKAKRMQSYVPQTETRIVEQPRFPFISHLKNKQAVRIGSNFSVNIEFYKELLPPKQFIDSKDYSEIGTSKKRISNSTKTKSIYPKYPSINDVESNTSHTGVNAENKASIASKVLRRCFCKPCVPQLSKVITVGRVEEHRIKTSINPPQYCVCFQVQKSQFATNNCVCVTDSPSTFCKATKTASTKIDKKYLKCKAACQNKEHTTSKKYWGNDFNSQKTSDMETILPYTPEKFNKKSSKSSFLRSNMNKEERKGNGKNCLSYCKYSNRIYQKSESHKDIYKKRSPQLSASAKRLTAKKGKKSIIEAKNMKICSAFNIKSAICRCKQIFFKQKNKLQYDTAIPPDKEPLCLSKKPKRLCDLSQNDVLKQSESERRPKDTHKTKPNKSKSLKAAQASERTKCQCCHCKQGGKKYSKFQSGDADQGKAIPAIVNVYKSGNLSDQYKKCICPGCQMQHQNNPYSKHEQQNKKVVQFLVNPANSYVNEVRKNHPTLIEFMANYICTSNKNHNKGVQSSKHQNLMAQNKTEKRINKRDAGKGDAASKSFGKVNKSFSNNKKAKTKSCPYCDLKQNRKNVEEKKKITAQPEIKQENLNKFCQPECVAKLKITPNVSKPRNEKESKQGKMDKKEAKDGVSQKKLNKKCACKTMPSKGMICECVNMSKSRNIIKSILNLVKPQKNCACHSSRCECAKVYRNQKKMKKILMLRERNLKRKIKRQKYAKKHSKNKKKNTEKRKRKEYNALQKKYKKEDALRRKKRLASDKYLEKRLKSIKNTRDLLLAADSLCDIAKLGCTVVGDVARSSCRAIKDPAHTIKRVKNTAKQPKRIWPIMKTAIGDSGASATAKRLVRRFKAMRNVKSLKNKLQQYEVTNYLMNMTNKDPRKRVKRLKKKKGNVRKREPMDFQCSLYMASLRKRPFLCVYYMCPWFYPHFVTLLQALKQFADMLLFLLAVVVWSPCILCMELCRAMMCCFLCTA